MSGTDNDAMGIRKRSAASKEAWKRTNDEMEAIAETRREAGCDVVSMPAVHTSPVGKAQGDDETFGLVHVIPDNHADAFTEAFSHGEFPQYHVYRNEVEGRVFLVTELVDPKRDRIVLIAAQYDLNHARAMIRSVIEESAIYTHARTIDGTELGSVRHEEFAPFVPDPQNISQRDSLGAGTTGDDDEKADGDEDDEKADRGEDDDGTANQPS